MAPKNPENSGEPDDTLDPIELAAAAWLVQRDRGLSPAQEEAFARWLQADERHPRIYAKLAQAWGLLDRVPAARVPLPSHRGRRWAWAAGSLAAAAAVAFAFVALDSARPTATPLLKTAVTPIGGFEKLVLPDGSVVHLNTSSAIEVAFTAMERRVFLRRGEASFTVAKDRARPFIVRVGQVDVRAVGTVFNVRCLPAAVEVLVTEGKVRVDDAASGRSLLAAQSESPALAPAPRTTAFGPPIGEPTPADEPLLVEGHRITIATAVSAPAAFVPVAVAPQEAARALAWQSRRLEFSAQPLAEVVAEFNRYNRHQLVIEDAELATQRFGGKFPANDIESFVLLLESNFGAIAERRAGETMLRRKPATSPRP